jgi:UDP-N-acetylglucosamine 2-epimerase
MKHGQRLEDVFASALTGISRVVHEHQPDCVIVQGDTTTTLAGALAGFYTGTVVGHVEAGLRTGDKRAPFPEEVNRRLTTHVADLHFAPTQHAAVCLLAEGVPDGDVYVTGNTVVDAVLEAAEMPYTFDDQRLEALASGRDGRFVLMTAHRRESWGAQMEQVCLGVRDVLDTFPDISLVFPVHRNPIVRETVDAVLAGHPRVLLTEPLDYLPFVHLMKAATLIMSDSGGVQEEAPSLGTPVVVLRETTERPEALEAGAVRLAGVTRDGVAAAGRAVLGDPVAYQAMVEAPNPFGDGQAARRIIEILDVRL